MLVPAVLWSSVLVSAVVLHQTFGQQLFFISCLLSSSLYQQLLSSWLDRTVVRVSSLLGEVSCKDCLFKDQTDSMFWLSNHLFFSRSADPTISLLGSEFV